MSESKTSRTKKASAKTKTSAATRKKSTNGKKETKKKTASKKSPAKTGKATVKSKSASKTTSSSKEKSRKAAMARKKIPAKTAARKKSLTKPSTNGLKKTKDMLAEIALRTEPEAPVETPESSTSVQPAPESVVLKQEGKASKPSLASAKHSDSQWTESIPDEIVDTSSLLAHAVFENNEHSEPIPEEELPEPSLVAELRPATMEEDNPLVRTEPIPCDDLRASIERSKEFLLSRQNREEGYWVDELESNATITAELIFFMHFMGQVDLQKQEKIVNYLLCKQREDGSWAIFFDAPGGCISTTTEAYMALKIAGISPDRPEMVAAREFITARGGIKQVRVFTKIFLAILGQVSWDILPVMPVEFILMPNWFPMNIYEMSSWSRSVIVPLLIIYSQRPVHQLTEEQSVGELFSSGDGDLSPEFSDTEGFWPHFFIFLDKAFRLLGKLPWKPFRKFAIKKAKKWILDHQEEEGDWAGIQPAMFNSIIAFKCLGYPLDHSIIVKGLESIDRFIIYRGDHLVMQSCISPLWDTGISCNALMDAGLKPDHPALKQAGEFFVKKQVVKRGDWKIKNPSAQPGGWAFEFYNELFPDNDDTAEILMAWHFIESDDPEKKKREFNRALKWLMSMQSENGGWGAFDQDNNQDLFNQIPFADHKAMLDPPTIDVTSRILWMLGILGTNRDDSQVQRAIQFVKSEQESDGSWFGRWGVNYIYGTWLAITGLHSIGENMNDLSFKLAADWLKSRQNRDGGWGETCDSYIDKNLAGKGDSTPSQTAWAIMGLVAAKEADCDEVRRGIHYLLNSQNEQGTWYEDYFTGTGFPGHFYIKYHMYEHYFPLMALARYRHAVENNSLEPRRQRPRE